MTDYKRFFETKNLNSFLSNYVSKEVEPMYFVIFLNAIRKNNEERLNEVLNQPDVQFKINRRTSETFLHLAARFGSLQLVERLIKLKVDVNLIDSFGQTACYMATVRSVEMVQLFLDNGAKIDIRSLSGVTMIQRALFSGSVDVVMLLLNRKYNMERNSNEEKSLNDSEKCKKIVNFLLEKRIDLNWTKISPRLGGYRVSDLRRYPLLLHFVGKYGDEETFDRVLSESTNINMNKFGPDKECTLLQVLVDAGKIDFVRKILKLGVDVNLKTRPNNTALHFAIMRENSEMVRLLIDRGADVYHESHPKNAPLLLAMRLENEEIMDMLLAVKVGINSMAEEGYVLHYACGSPYLFKVCILRYAINYLNPEKLMNESGSSLRMIKFLIKRRADFNVKLSDGLTPILVACRAGRMDIVKFLSKLGADMNEVDYGENGVLYHSVMGNNIDLVRFLLRKGYEDKEGWNDYLYDLCSLEHDDVSEMAEFVIDNTVNVKEVFGESQWNPILSAISSRKPKTVEGLLELVSTHKIPFGAGERMPIFKSCALDDLDSIYCVQLFAAFLAMKGVDISIHMPIKNQVRHGLGYNQEHELEIYDQGYEDSMEVFYASVRIYHRFKLELYRMESKEIGDTKGFTYFDFLSGQLLDVLPFTNRKKLIDDFKTGNYKKWFPLHSFLLKERFKRLEKLRIYSNLIKIFLMKKYAIQKPFPVDYLYRLFSFCGVGGVRNFGRALSTRRNSYLEENQKVR